MAKYKDKNFILLPHNTFVDEKIIIRDQEGDSKELPSRHYFYKCDICSKEFCSGSSIRKGYKKICSKHHFYYTCDYCHKEFEILRLGDFIGSEKPLRFCSHNCALQYRNRTPEMIQKVVDMNTSRVKINLEKKQTCKKCGKNFNSIFLMDICNACITSKTNTENTKRDQICKKCGKIFHSPFIMDLGPCCNPNLKQTNFKQPNFITKNNVRFYKGIEVNEFSKKILSGELKISNYPGINIRFGRVFYKTQDIITGNIKYLSNTSFIEEQNLLYYFDRSYNNYVPWIEYKTKFKVQNIDWQLPEDFKLIPTFREQDSSSWEGARSAFEQSLLDDNISWFVYIKFYISASGRILPLVVGKSGSLLVNASGSDLSFSTNPDDGPARKFLIEENLNWCRTQIAILPCMSEQLAYEQEKHLTNEYQLFNS